MGKNEELKYKIVFFDVDGTLINTKQLIPSSTKRAIKELQNKNVTVVISTGRPIYEAKPIMEELGVKDIVTMNGGVAYVNGKMIVNKKMNHNLVQEIINQTKKLGEAMTIFGTQCSCSLNTEHRVFQDFIKTFKFEELRGKSSSLDAIGEPLLITVYCQKNESEKQYSFATKALEMVKWSGLVDSGYHLDFHPIGQSKADGLKIILNELKIPQEQAIAFGDGMNDVEMIEFAGLGVAMGNAPTELKEKANLVAPHVDNDGIERVLKEIGLI